MGLADLFFVFTSICLYVYTVYTLSVGYLLCDFSCLPSPIDTVTPIRVGDVPRVPMISKPIMGDRQQQAIQDDRR